eukprot:scaffold2475_cov87-Skeletonema_marinoi.AAC.1
MSYLGPVDLDALRSDEDKNRAELQATEFGIVPDKLFRKEHPGKGESWEGTGGLVMPDVLRDSYTYGASSSDRITKKENTGSNDGFSLEDGTNPFA